MSIDRRGPLGTRVWFAEGYAGGVGGENRPVSRKPFKYILGDTSDDKNARAR